MLGAEWSLLLKYRLVWIKGYSIQIYKYERKYAECLVSSIPAIVNTIYQTEEAEICDVSMMTTKLDCLLAGVEKVED